jgi:hypothetical protein
MFLKNVTLGDLSEKYGEACRGLVLQKHVNKGEKLWPRQTSGKQVFTRAQLTQIISERPSVREAVRSFSYLVGDDLRDDLRYALMATQWIHDSSSITCVSQTVAILLKARNASL